MSTSDPQTGAVSDVAAAKFLGVSTQWLRVDRRDKKRVPYVRLGGRIVYRIESLAEFLRQQEAITAEQEQRS